MSRIRTLAVLSLIAPSTVLLGACGQAGPDEYEATISRTSYGIPHIVADDWGGLGFGEGYAFAEDHLCSMLCPLDPIPSIYP